MTWRLFGLRLMPLVALLWGLPSEAKAEISRQVVFDRGAEKIEAIEPQLFRSVKPPLMTQTAAVKQNDIEQDVLFNVEGTLAEGDVRFEDGSLHDVHAFEGQADQLVRITLTSDEFDTFLILQDALGEELARNDDGSNGTNAEIIFRLPTAQQYLIVANAYDETGKGAYRLIVERADETALSDEVALSDETALSDVPQKTEADHLLQRGNEAF
ncbi:MAG: PPC domain-containing protein, partial [Cyanobacteria bacterium J06598_1]